MLVVRRIFEVDIAVGSIQRFADNMDAVIVLFDDAEAFEIAKKKYKDLVR